MSTRVPEHNETREGATLAYTISRCPVRTARVQSPQPPARTFITSGIRFAPLNRSVTFSVAVPLHSGPVSDSTRAT